ncbi:hypothetical protein ACSU6B_17420 [Neobacillus sp. C211]|uniref:hypothetical protein n=1 Tax=unclassified Neobacillus TaxID=2675272 RepID=UPI003978F93A
MKRNNFLYVTFLGIILTCMFSVFIFLPLRFGNWNPGVTSEWVGFAGAVIGGIIAGGLTLLGVRYTILDKDKDTFLKSYFKHAIMLDEIDKRLLSIRHNIIITSLTNMGQAHFNLRNNLQTIEDEINRIKVDIGGKLALTLHHEYESQNFNINHNDTVNAMKSFEKITSEIGLYREEIKGKYEFIEWKY